MYKCKVCGYEAREQIECCGQMMEEVCENCGNVASQCVCE